MALLLAAEQEVKNGGPVGKHTGPFFFVTAPNHAHERACMR
jgi:hypothetical protein